MGIKTQKQKENELRECVYCKIRYPIEVRFCDTCSRPLDVIDAIQMGKEQEARTKSLILETLRQEHSNKSKELVNKKLEEENQQLRKILSKTLNDIQ
jgi:hypothetical protein